MALHAQQQARLDRVLVIPTGNPPHKADIAAAEDRWRMVCAACAGQPTLEPSRVELDRPGVIYTVDTLALLQAQYPKAAFFYIIGADTLMELQHWRSYQQVLGMCSFLVCPRTWRFTPQQLQEECRRLEALGASITLLDTPMMDVSSTELRAALSAGAPTPLLPAPVQEYCAAKGLYGASQRVPQAEAWLDKLFADLSPKRFAHVLAVAYAARSLAPCHGVDPLKAELAGLLHDCAKCMPLKDMRAIALAHRLAVDAELMESTSLLHAPVGACLARTAYGVQDPEIIQAIQYHNTGTPGMSHLDMVVYLADKIEPTRAEYPTLATVRRLAETSLEQAMIASMEGTVRHVAQKKYPLYHGTLDTLSWLHSL